MIKCKYEGTGIWNGRCTGTKEVDTCPGYDNCKQYKPNYTTNADRIRAMSDEELAEVLYGDPVCVERRYCSEYGCKDCILDWLRLPIKDGEGDD